jgi:branched-chain amino acid transport system substrate-binding protein
MADFALQDLNAKSAVVLTCAGKTYSLGLSRIFISRFKQQGGAILWEGDYLEESTDFRKLLVNVKGLAPDVIFLPGYQRDSGYIIKQARNMGLSAIFLGGDSWSIKMYTYGEDAIEGSYYSTHWDAILPNQRAKEFVKRYEGKYPIDEIISFGMAYDAVFLLADAVSRAKSLEPSMIREGLASTENFPGITGNISMDENGDPIKSLVISRFENGGSVYIKTVAPQQGIEKDY